MRMTIYFGTILVMVLPACSAQQTGVGPASTPQVQLPINGSINVGEPLTGTFLGSSLNYTLTAHSYGKLTARLTWNPDLDGARLKLTVSAQDIGDRAFPAGPPSWSPVVAVLPLSAGGI